MASKIYRINDEERKMLMMALGELARLKPDLDFYLRRLAIKFDGPKMYERAQKVKPGQHSQASNNAPLGR